MTLPIAHRRNTLAQLRETPSNYGVEVDVRLFHGQIVVAHDPFQPGVLFEDWLAAYAHQLLVVNIKEEGLAGLVLPLLDQAGVTRFFFLDQTFPFLMKTLAAGERRVAVRVSDLEHPGTAHALAGRAMWAWVDGFQGFPLPEQELLKLIKAGYKLCLVSPELHGRSMEEVEQWQERCRALSLQFDAVCTKVPESWLRELS